MELLLGQLFSATYISVQKFPHANLHQQLPTCEITMSRTIAIIVLTDDEEEVTHELPAKNEVCDRCEGYGHHTNPNIDGNGITQSEWAEWDIEDRESYLSGEYDVSCEECHGNKVTQVVDEELCSPEQLQILQQWAEQEGERYASDAADRRYQRMECGEY